MQYTARIVAELKPEGERSAWYRVTIIQQYPQRTPLEALDDVTKVIEELNDRFVVVIQSVNISAAEEAPQCSKSA